MISVIVPVYHAERYLPRCIESILKQTYQDFELILVDDGSLDKSGMICDAYAKRDGRIKVIHKENGGVSSARNAGLDIAEGQYISFVDSDDWIEENYLERLLAPMKEYDVQLSICSLDFRDLKVGYLTELQFEWFDYQNPIFTDCVAFFNSWQRYGPWVKLFSREIIEKYHIRFRVNIKHGEDTLFVNDYLYHCKRIYIINDALYHYNRLVEQSATRKFYPEYIDWNYTLIMSLEKLLSKVNLLENQKQQILNMVVIGRVVDIVSRCAKNLSKQETLRSIQYTISQYGRWILPEAEYHPVTDRKHQLRVAIQAKDVEEIYREQRKLLGARYQIKQFIKRGVYTILSPYIERKRDGLISFKEKQCVYKL